MRLNNSALQVLLLAVLVCFALALNYLTGSHKTRISSPAPTGLPSISLRVGAPAPDLALLDKDGNPYRPSAYRGRRVLLAFFRDSPECVRFAPRWEKLHRRSPEVVVLGIAANGPGEIEGFRRESKVSFPLLFDRDYDRNRLDEQIRCPFSVTIDEEGMIASLSGPADAPAGNSR